LGNALMGMGRVQIRLLGKEELDSGSVVAAAAAAAAALEEVEKGTKDETDMVEIVDGHDESGSVEQTPDLFDGRTLRLPGWYPSPSRDKLELSNPTSLLSISVWSKYLSKL
jgi:hypothetical protein